MVHIRLNSVMVSPLFPSQLGAIKCKNRLDKASHHKKKKTEHAFIFFATQGGGKKTNPKTLKQFYIL